MLRSLASLLFVLTVASGATEGDPHPPPPEGPPPSARPLPFYYDLYTFRGEAGATTVVASFAVHLEELEEKREKWASRYGFDVSLVLADTALGSVTRTDDSVFVRLPRSLSGEHLLHTQVEIRAPPSVSTVQRVVMTDASAPGIGQLYSSPYPVPDYSGPRLMLSDVALGLPDAVTGWERGDATLALLPTSLFPESAFDVYYEIYNLPSGRPYTTEISIERLADPDGGPADPDRAVKLRFTGESTAGPDGSLAELRRVESSLARGRYRVTVTVTDESTGRTARRARRFHVRGWGPGATMVPALPRKGSAVATGGDASR